MYSLVLTLHSWIRWILVIAAAVACVRSGYALKRGLAYSLTDSRIARGLTNLLNVQLLLGLLLYVFLSPVVRTAISDLGEAMASSTLRFFVIEHQVAALLAIAIGHWGLMKARRAERPDTKHRFVFRAAAGCLLMILIAIPWPFLPYARALFRL